MEWLRTHPYASALGGAGLLIVAGTFIVVMKSSAAPAASSTVAWGGAGAVVDASYVPGASSPQGSAGIMQQAQNSAPYTYILPTPQTTNTDTGEATGDGFNYDAFILALSSSGGGSPGGQAAGDASAAGAYSFIPGGLISTTTQGIKRTKLQQAIYNYGNDVGSLVQSFEQEHPNETQVLMNQAQDRTDADKAAAVQAIGRALSAMGDSMLAMDGVPSPMSAGHQALVKSYRDIGAKLALVPQAKSDADFIAAIESYNAAAGMFTQNYVELANLFVASGVVFSQGDSGSVFTFTPTSL